jgi:hypothetical protein
MLVRAASLLSLKFLTILLVICFALTTEEDIHLIRSHPNWTDFHRNLYHHPGCTPLDPTGRIFRCPVPGYNNMVFLCASTGCAAKEPTSGYFITPLEKALLDQRAF